MPFVNHNIKNNLLDQDTKHPLCGMTIEELSHHFDEEGIGSSYALKIAYWVYKKRINGIQEISNVSKEIKGLLSARYYPGLYSPVRILRSADNSEKYMFSTPDGRCFETVYLPEGKRKTLCVSSQAGCRMGCTFCLTGGNGFNGNLSAGEIINQIISSPHAGEITHIVFMGMGEPMDNVIEVIKACNIITAEWGLSISNRNVTVSTVGITEGIVEFLKQSRCNIAFSLYSPFSEERSAVIPAERRYPFSEIMKVLSYGNRNARRRISIAYMMINAINDTDVHLNALKELLKGTGIKVNLLTYNETNNPVFMPSSPERMQFFKHDLVVSGISASIRKSRGIDISAACGQLAGENIGKTVPE